MMSGWEQDDQHAKLKQALGEKTPEDIPTNKRKHGLAASLSGSSIPFAPGSTLPRGMKTATTATTIVKPSNSSQSTQPVRRRNTPPPPPTDSSPPKIKITAGFSLSVNKTPPTPVNHKEFVKEDIQQFSDHEQSPRTSHHGVRKENPRNSLPFRSQHSTHSVEISREQDRRGNFIESSQSGLKLREMTRGQKANMRSSMDSLVMVGLNEVAPSTNMHEQQNPSNFQRTTRSNLSRKTNQSQGITVLDPPTAMPSSSSNKRAPPVTASSSPPTTTTKTRTQPNRSAKKAPKEPECIELLDDEEEEVERKKWIEPFLSKIYPINKIFFGAYEQKPVEEGDPNYLRIDGSNNCFVFVFGPDKRENLQFFDIRNYQAGCYDNEETIGYLMIHIHPTTDFQYSVVGQGKSLDPTTVKGYKTRKYISILMPLGEVKELERALANIPSLKSKSGIPTEMDNSLIQILKHLEEVDQQKIEISVMKDLQIKKELFNSDLTGQRVTRRRASVLNSGLPTTYSAEDSRVYVIYPPEIEATDAVTISYGDLRRLEPSIYFNDNLIDLKIKHLISQLPEEKRTKVHAFSCLFYAKLLEAKDPKEQHQLVHRWTKNVDLFSLEFILFPINLRNHWSLMVMARPQAWIDQQLAENDEKGESENKSGRRLKKGSKAMSENESKRDEDKESNLIEDSPNLGVFLHMDSLRMHPSASIANILGKYLLNEKEAKDNPEKSEEGNKATIDNAEAKESNELIPMDSTASVMIIDNPPAKKEEEEAEAEEEAIIMNTDEEGDKTGSEEGVNGKGNSSGKSKRKLSGKKLMSLSSPGRRETNCVKCIVPIQENGYDCGVFVIRFAEMILDKWPTTTINDIQDKCRSQFSGEFTQEDIHIERTKIRSLLESLREDWLIKNPDKAKEQKEKEEEKEKEKILIKEVEKEDDKDLYSLDDKDGEAFYHNELTAPTTFPNIQNEDEPYFLQTMPYESNPPSQNKENEEEENDMKVGSTDYFSPPPANHSNFKPTAFFSKELFKSRCSKEEGKDNDNEKVQSSFKRPVPLTQALQKETDEYINYNKEEEWEEGVIEELNITIHLGDSDDNISTEEQLPQMSSTIPDEDNTTEAMSEQVSDNNDSDDLIISRMTRKKRSLEEEQSVPIVNSQQAKKKKKR